MLGTAHMNCVKASCLALLITSAACTSHRLAGSEDHPMHSSSKRSMLTDVAIRRLLSDAHVAPFSATEVISSHPSGENFFANGAYQRVSGRSTVEGTFEISDGVLCVQGADFSRQCRKVLSESDGTYRFIDTADGSSIIVAISPLK